MARKKPDCKTECPPCYRLQAARSARRRALRRLTPGARPPAIRTCDCSHYHLVQP